MGNIWEKCGNYMGIMQINRNADIYYANILKYIDIIINVYK